MPAAPTAAQSQASRQNGARSRGPATPEGKARAARNGVRHGLSGRTFFLLADEDPAAYQDLATDYLAALAPRDLLEHQAVETLVQTLWREQRAGRLEAEALDARFAAALIEDPAEARAARQEAMRDFDRFLRYGARLARDRARAEHDLEALRRRTLAAPRPRPLQDEPEVAAALAVRDEPDGPAGEAAAGQMVPAADPLAAVQAALAAVRAAREAAAEMAASLGLRHEPDAAAASLVRDEPEPTRKLNRHQRRALAARARRAG